jgi:hypothetical protein
MRKNPPPSQESHAGGMLRRTPHGGEFRGGFFVSLW